MERLHEIGHSFAAMNTRVEALVCVPKSRQAEVEATLEQVRVFFGKVEHALSRFLPESELSRLNRASGHPFSASPVLFEVVEGALNSAQLTGGIFNPAILPFLNAAGYDHSFELLKEPPSAIVYNTPAVIPDWQGIRLDALTQIITLPAGCRLDLGGIAKGWTVDRAGQMLNKFSHFAVNAGGDIVAGGSQIDGQPWAIGVSDPLDSERHLLTLPISGRAVCTSTTAKRKWQSNGVWHHHLIDPRSGRPSESGVISATVVAPTAVLAETFSKAALILGPLAGRRLIESQPDIYGMLVLKDGSCLKTSRFPVE
jgi:FAD:protein FMN transferase